MLVGGRVLGGVPSEQDVAQVYTSLDAGLARLGRPSEKKDLQSRISTSTKPLMIYGDEGWEANQRLH